MDDERIIELYFKRDEQAVSETRLRYGAYCSAIAFNILESPEDTEEVLNDALLAAWQSIPPKRPQSLKIYLGKMVRNISISRWRESHAKKRFSGLDIMLSELDECIPAVVKRTVGSLSGISGALLMTA